MKKEANLAHTVPIDTSVWVELNQRTFPHWLWSEPRSVISLLKSFWSSSSGFDSLARPGETTPWWGADVQQSCRSHIHIFHLTWRILLPHWQKVKNNWHTDSERKRGWKGNKVANPNSCAVVHEKTIMLQSTYMVLCHIQMLMLCSHQKHQRQNKRFIRPMVSYLHSAPILLLSYCCAAPTVSLSDGFVSQ